MISHDPGVHSLGGIPCGGHQCGGQCVGPCGGTCGACGAARYMDGGAVAARSRPLGSWTAIWVGERAFRNPSSMKEQMEAAGFLVKIYRSHDKCSRALDKKPHISPTNVFVVSEADAEPMLAYLQGRGCAELRFIVDVDGTPAKDLSTRLQCPEDAAEVAIATTWDE